MIAGSDTGNGAASSLTDSSGSAASRITSARRVGSDNAAKVRSRVASENLTIWLSIKRCPTCQIFLPPPSRAGGFNVTGPIHPFLKVGAVGYGPMMDANLISAFFGAQVGMMQLAVAGDLAQMDSNNPSSDNSSEISQLVGAGDSSANSLANVAAGIGTNLDMVC
jgi:hypothetical protein